ncbi:hypothetical protein GCM10023081_09900 [Arthrobacter ginkgonis]|uniref:Uncharacterized protein n=1 Tax=Arthrobacter ginkgonis TaxID=1630594 RepID=A0ABP7C017_9MICC
MSVWSPKPSGMEESRCVPPSRTVANWIGPFPAVPQVAGNGPHLCRAHLHPACPKWVQAPRLAPKFVRGPPRFFCAPGPVGGADLARVRAPGYG